MAKAIYVINIKLVREEFQFNSTFIATKEPNDDLKVPYNMYNYKLLNLSIPDFITE